MGVVVVRALRRTRGRVREGSCEQEPLDRFVAEVAYRRGVTEEAVRAALNRGLAAAVRKELKNRAIRGARQQGKPVNEVVVPEVDIRWEGTPPRPVAYARTDPTGDWRPAGIDSKTLGRQLVNIVRQVLLQGLAEAGNREVAARIEEAVGELANGKVVGRHADGWEVALAGRLEGVRGLLPDEKAARPVQPGDTVWAVVVRLGDAVGPVAVLDQRGHKLVLRLLEAHVQEVAEGVVEVTDIAREPGQGTMVSVRSRDRRVDPVGAVVGHRAQRLQQVQAALGEPIWVVRWAEDLCEYVRYAMAPTPAETRLLGWDGQRWHVQVTVPRGALERAVGKGGLHARLASWLCRCRVTVVEDTPVRLNWDVASFQ